MDYCKKLHMICFDFKELRDIHRYTIQLYFRNYINTNKDSLSELLTNRKKQKRLKNKIYKEKIHNRTEFQEMFIAVEKSYYFYNNSNISNIKICLPLQDNVDYKKIKVETLEDISDLLKERSLVDFAIWGGDNMRQFQLKQYKNKLKTDSLIEFIKNKTYNYGGNMGDVNLLIQLQDSYKKDLMRLQEDNKKEQCLNEDFLEFDFDFEKINKELKKDLGDNYKSEILVAYNEENEYSVITEVFPNCRTMKKNSVSYREIWNL